MAEDQKPEYKRPPQPEIDLAEPMIRFQIGSCVSKYDVNTARRLHDQLGRALAKYEQWEASQRQAEAV